MNRPWIIFCFRIYKTEGDNNWGFYCNAIKVKAGNKFNTI